MKKTLIYSMLVSLILLTLSSNVYAGCSVFGPGNADSTSPIYMGFYGEYYSGSTYDYIRSRLFVNSQGNQYAFTTQDMTEIARLNSPNAPMANPSSSYRGGLKWEYECDDVWRGGYYVYGKIDSLTLNMHTDGTTGNSWGDSQHSPNAFGAAQIYTLATSYSYANLRKLMSDVSGNYYYDVANSLTLTPTTRAVHAYQHYQGTRTESLSVYSSYGVYYVAVAGGHDSQNGEWNDDDDLKISMVGDYLVSPRLLKNIGEINAFFTTNGKTALFESQSAMCGLIGQHISAQGFTGQPGKIKCCGAPQHSSNGLGQFNLQYECTSDAAQPFYKWQSVCSLATRNSAQQAIYDQYCLGCDTSTTGRCTGNLQMTCQGTYSCNGQDEDVCNSLAGCEYEYDYQLVCNGPTQQIKGVDGRIIDVPAGESFGSIPVENFLELPPTGSDCYYQAIPGSQDCRATSGGSGTTRSCSGLSASRCEDISGCSLRDSTGGGISSTSTCNSFTYDMDECRLRNGCTWECRGDAGMTCDTNADCKAPLQCDADFNGVKRCHATDDRCVIDGTGAEAIANSFTCSDGVYKQCGVGSMPYTASYCSSTLGFTCTGTPNPQACSGYGSCYGLTGSSTCNGYNGCSWVSVGYCSGSYTCGGGGGGAIAQGTTPNANIKPFSYESLDATTTTGTIDKFLEALPPGGDPSYCSCSDYSSSGSCNAEPECSWVSPYCSGSIDCDAYSLGSCPTSMGCTISPSFTTCSGQTYSACAGTSTNPTGCARSCVLPAFNTAIDPNTNAAACTCAGKNLVTCSLDADNDGMASSTTITRCESSAPNTPITYNGQTYICNYNGTADCNDGSATQSQQRCYIDHDRDTYASNATSIMSCTDGTVNTPIDQGGERYICTYDGPFDCNDNSPAVTFSRCMIDNDADTYAHNSSEIMSCTLGNNVPVVGPAGKSYICNYLLPLDCNDEDGTVHSSATCYIDMDNDGYASAATSMTSCAAGTNAQINGTGGIAYICSYTGVFDCDDSNAAVSTTCGCNGYVPYNTRIGFPESPTFRVNATGTIRDICDYTSTGQVVTRGIATMQTGGFLSSVPVNGPSTSLNLPPCKDGVSETKYCEQLGYDPITPSTVTASGSCAAWVASAWKATTGLRVMNMSCSYYTEPSYNVVFGIRDTDNVVKPAKYNCTASKIGSITTTGPDGVCIDDFNTTTKCGFISGLPVDPDCGNHTWMRCGNVRKIDGSVINTCTVPTIGAHKACATPTDCVFDTIAGQPLCIQAGTVVDSGTLDPFRQPVKIGCSLQQNWCFNNYGYNSLTGTCQFTQAEACYVNSCPGLTNFAMLPDGAVYYNGTIYKINTTTGECTTYNTETGKTLSCSGEGITVPRLTLSEGITSFVRDKDCTINIGKKIRGVCVASQTYPEMKYNAQDVIVK